MLFLPPTYINVYYYSLSIYKCTHEHIYILMQQYLSICLSFFFISTCNNQLTIYNICHLVCNPNFHLHGQSIHEDVKQLRNEDTIPHYRFSSICFYICIIFLVKPQHDSEQMSIHPLNICSPKALTHNVSTLPQIFSPSSLIHKA